MLINPRESRRQFLRSAGRFAAAGVTAPLALNLAAVTAVSAQTASPYRALVYISTGGGNDIFNTLVPYDTSSYNSYAAVRPGIALARAELIPFNAASAQGGRQVAMNPRLQGMKTLYDAKRLAILAGVGNLIVPLSKPRVGLDPTPSAIGSHVDQFYQTSSSRSGNGADGWGGLMGDVLAASNGAAAFTSVSTKGYARFLDTARGYFTAGPYAAPQPFIQAGSGLDTAITRASQRTNLLEQVIARANERSRDEVALLANSIAPQSSFPAPPDSGASELARQLNSVARIIAGRSALGIRRQIFYVEMGGFDSHSNQIYDHGQNMLRLNDALVYFDGLLGQLGLRDSVTTFTADEFGRTLVSNGDGTDHGWGSHYFVMGGAVSRSDIFGLLPTIAVNGPDIFNTAMLPTTANVQVSATLARWMGVGAADIDRIFPDLRNFNSPDLGFLKA
jgi:uncharacterized protein (DUF1501 family)